MSCLASSLNITSTFTSADAKADMKFMAGPNLLLMSLARALAFELGPDISTMYAVIVGIMAMIEEYDQYESDR